MAPDLAPETLRSVQRLAATSNMSAVAKSAELELRNGLSVNIRRFEMSYYPVSFATGKNISISVLEWLFPSTKAQTDEFGVVSPIGKLTQIFLLTQGLISHLSLTGYPEALEVVLQASVWTDTTGSEVMTDNQRQHALDQALRCAQDEDTIQVLIAHGADPQQMANGISTTPFAASSPTFRTITAPVYIDNGVFLSGKASLLPSH